ncbi:putative transcription factor MYB-related family [Helianthus annuus]|nr:putative transcription factor MYB-related family [Helianthus annuus]
MEKFGAGIEELRGVGDDNDEKCGDRVKGPWSPEEDAILSRLVANFGARNWSLIARGILGRSGKSCRLRWCNQLDLAVKRKPFTGTSGWGGWVGVMKWWWFCGSFYDDGRIWLWCFGFGGGVMVVCGVEVVRVRV